MTPATVEADITDTDTTHSVILVFFRRFQLAWWGNASFPRIFNSIVRLSLGLVG
jgi:hypothetical protein